MRLLLQLLSRSLGVPVLGTSAALALGFLALRVQSDLLLVGALGSMAIAARAYPRRPIRDVALRGKRVSLDAQTGELLTHWEWVSLPMEERGAHPWVDSVLTSLAGPVPAWCPCCHAVPEEGHREGCHRAVAIARARENLIDLERSV